MHLLSASQIRSTRQLESLFSTSDAMKSGGQVSVARGRVLGFVKDEGSTRTRVSFEVAMKRLGGEVVVLELDNNSSAAKGETVEDSVRTLGEYVDVVVMRNSQKGTVGRCAGLSGVPVINAGDGDGEHPTQALLDAYTIKEHFGRLGGLKVAFAGDLMCSRTIHSLLHILSLYDGNECYLTCPEGMELPVEYKPSNLKFEEVEKPPKDANVLYVTRLQKERREDSPDSYFVLEPGELGDGTVVLHPFPRNGEIPTSFDSDRRALYFKQIKNGMYVRMALLYNYFRVKDFIPEQ